MLYFRPEIALGKKSLTISIVYQYLQQQLEHTVDQLNQVRDKNGRPILCVKGFSKTFSKSFFFLN